MRGAVVTSPGTLTLDELAGVTGGRLLVGPGERPLRGVAIDSRVVRPGELFVAILGARLDGHEFVAEAAARGAAAALVQREVSVPPGLGLVRVADTTRALAELAAHARRTASIPVVGITGSTGKTTTKDMTAALLGTRGAVLKTEGNLNNRYGLPLTLLRLRPEHWAAALEMGMSAPGELRQLARIARPDVAVITNIGAAHLEFFSSLDEIARAKAEILEGLRPDGVAVLNGDDPRTRRIGETWKGDVVWFGREGGHDVSAANERATPAGMRFELRIGGRVQDVILPMLGPHFVMDFLAAAAAAHRLGVDPARMAEAGARMEAGARRGQVRHLGQQVKLLDDCYNASPDSLEAAVVALGLAAPGRRVAFLGDMLELGAAGPELHFYAGERLAGRVDLVVAVGPLASHAVEGARRAGFDGSALRHFPDSAVAVEAVALVEPGDTVLVKGSRGMRMERVVEALVTRFGTTER